MKKLWKRNMVAGAVLLLVCGAIFLNGRYAQQVEETDKILGQATLVDGTEGDAEEVSGEALPGDYFATARLTRQQSRDQALSLLETAACAESASQDVIDSAMNEITVMANWSLLESKIENELLAKDFADCVVYLSSQGCTVAVPSGADGLTETQVAQITDAVLSNTEMSAAAINVIEVRN